MHKSPVCSVGSCCSDLMFLAYCLLDETEDEDVNREYVEETNRDAVMIAAAKLIASDAVPKVNGFLLLKKLYFDEFMLVLENVNHQNE